MTYTRNLPGSLADFHVSYAPNFVSLVSAGANEILAQSLDQVHEYTATLDDCKSALRAQLRAILQFHSMKP